MKILILTDRLDIGGAETHIAQLAEALFDRGEEIVVASSGGAVADRLEKKGITHLRMPLGTHSPIRLWCLRKKIRKLIKSKHFEIAHAHARVPAFLIRGVRRWGCAEIVTVHAKFRTGLLRRVLSYWGENSIAVSEDLRSYLHNVYEIPMQRITVIPNGIDLSHFSPIKSRNSSSTLHILFASRMDADCSRGAELLCEIAPLLAEHISKFCITLVGGGDQLPEIAKRAEKINHTLGASCILVSGEVRDMAPLLQKQDIFVGVSRAALEAAACGCSVVLCGNEGYGGILTKETFWEASLSNFCARGMRTPDAKALLDDLLSLAALPTVRKENALECRKLLEHWYDAASVCSQTLSVYQKSLHKRLLKTVAIGGYFGCGNLGDDAILQSFIEYTRIHYPNIRILALTKNPRKDSRRFGVRCYKRKGIFALVAAFLRADVFLCGGGSLLQNVTGRLTLYYYLCMLRFAKLCGALPVLYAAGIGPLHGNQAQRATKKALMVCPYISLRDPESLRYLQVLNMDAAKLHLGADAALLLPKPPYSRTFTLQKRIGASQKQGYACICLKSGKHTADTRRTVIAALRMFCRQADLLPVFFPLDEDDVSANAEAARMLEGQLFLPDEPSDVAAVLRGAKFLVTMRLHGLILATTVAIPAVGISTADDRKLPSFARLSAQECLTPDNLSLAALVEICQAFHTRGDALRPIIADACRDLQKKAEKDLANIATMVYNSGRYFKKSEDTV